MKTRARWLTGGVALAAVAAAWWWIDADRTHFLPAQDTAFIANFVATFSPPPAADSAATRDEVAELLALQASRRDADVAAARADRKTEVRRFYGALGLNPEDPPDLPLVEKLAEHVEDDVRIYVRAVKDHYRRLRPYEIEPRLEPCIDNVQGDLSYPSGHAAFAWAMAGVLSDLAPERRAALESRAEEFARQRAVCGVHFPSDLAAGRRAAEWVLGAIRIKPEYSAEAAQASIELREALELPMQRPTPN